MTDLSRQTDEALHEQKEWLRVALSSMGDGVITIDKKGGVTFLNSVAESLTGWTQNAGRPRLRPPPRCIARCRERSGRSLHSGSESGMYTANSYV